MGKFVGWKCDVCNNAEDGNDAPVDWLRLRLPTNGADNTRDLCSDKCLLKFAKERVGGTVQTKRQGKIPGLREYFISLGLKPQMIGPKMAAHVRSQHEVKGMVTDCPVCEFLTQQSA